MKGLILKDLYNIRFTLVGAVLLTIFPNLIMMLAGGGMSVSDDPMTRDMGFLVYGLVNYVSIALFSSLSLSTFSRDKSCGWDRYQRTMPVTSGQIMLGKMLTSCIVIGIITAVSLVLNMMGLFGISAELLVAMPICFGILMAICIMPVLPLTLKLGERLASYIYLAMLAAEAGLMVLIFLGAMTSSLPAVAIRIAAYAVLPAAAAAVAVVCYRAGKKGYEQDL